jgi:FkbM family methyltransferase
VARLHHALNAILCRLGVKLIRADSVHFPRSAAPYGIEPLTDIARLAGGNPLRTVFDVGANVGRFSRSVADQFPGATVYAFEPIASTFAALKAATADCPQVHPFPLACGSEPGRRTIPLYQSHQMNTLADTPVRKDLCGQQTGTAEIEIETVDDFCRNHRIDRIDLLKTDTEGHDLEVFRGATSILAAGTVRFVYAEFYYLRQPASTSGTLIDLADFLAGFNFHLVTTYTEYVSPDKNYFGVHNALFAAAQ